MNNNRTSSPSQGTIEGTDDVQVELPPSVTGPAALPRRTLSLPWAIAIWVGVLLVGLLIPLLVTNRAQMGLLLEAAVLAQLALGIAFIARYSGVISLGHTAFFGASAYIVGMLITHAGLSMELAFIGGIVGGTILAAGIGALTSKARGIRFLMLTLALGQAVYEIVVQQFARPLTGAHDGLLIKYPQDGTFFGLEVRDLMIAGRYWPIVWIALVLVAVSIWLLGRSNFGQTLIGIRENEERMRFSGYGTFVPRWIAFILSGLFASIGGALFVLNAGFISADVMGFIQAGDALISAIVGGLGTLLGPIVGAGLFTMGQGYLNTGGNLHMYVGIALIIALTVMPGGITGAIVSGWRRLRGKARKGQSE